MSSILKHWREAATLLLVAKTRAPVVSVLQTTNYEVLMLKRSGKSKFMPSQHVFPGGTSHDADFSPAWLDLFKQTGTEVSENLMKFLKRGGQGASMFSRKRPEEFSQVPSELAFRITAIRETFEEAGVLIVRDINRVKNENINELAQPLSGKSSILSDAILSPWRKKVDDDAWEFLKMCQELNVVPDVWSLFEWSNWLTPVQPRAQVIESKPAEGKHAPRRFDTAFYLCVLDYIPHAVHDDKETTELEWTSAGLLLEKHSNRSLQLAPPQITELGRLLNFNDVDNLKQFAWERSAVRANRWLPVPCLCKDGGILYLYPGDDLYPEKPDFEGEHPIMSISYTVEEARVKHTNYNRNEISRDESGKMIASSKCNIKMTDGQVSPIFGLDKLGKRSLL